MHNIDKASTSSNPFGMMNCFVFTFLPFGDVANSRVVGMEHVANSLSFFARDCLHSSSSKRAFRMVRWMAEALASSSCTVRRMMRRRASSATRASRLASSSFICVDVASCSVAWRVGCMTRFYDRLTPATALLACVSWAFVHLESRKRAMRRGVWPVTRRSAGVVHTA